MKVTLEENYRRLYTLEDLDQAKTVIAECKDNYDDCKVWAEMAANEAVTGTVIRVIECSAHTAKNGEMYRNGRYNYFSRTNPATGEEIDTGIMDVWVDFLAETWDGFVKGGAYLSDIIQTGGEHYKDRMYIAEYKRA